MRLQVLGMGCPKCKKLYEATATALKELGLEDCELEKVQDLEEIAAAGVMLTPALVVDGNVLVSGRVPSSREIADLLRNG